MGSFLQRKHAAEDEGRCAMEVKANGRPLKRAREEGEQGEEETNLLKLMQRRRTDVESLVGHIAHLQKELEQARVKLAEAEGLLRQIRGSPLKSNTRGDRLVRGVKKEDTSYQNGSVAKERPTLAIPSSSDAPLERSRKVGNSEVTKENTSNKIVGAIASRAHPTNSALGASEHSRLAAPGSDSGRAHDGKANVRLSGGDTVTKRGTGMMQREHVELISSIRSQKRPVKLDVGLATYIPIQHKRKPRSLVLSPASDHLCATSGLDGVVNFWKIQEKGLGINLSHTVDCIAPGARHWPEDLAWHPTGHALFAIHTADGGGPQVSIIKTSRKKAEVEFLKEKPHEKGMINNIEFMPWSNGTQFATGGCDHAVVLWNEKEGGDGWHPHLLHRMLHSSAVTGVGGIPHKQLILSSGMDKRLFAVDPGHGRTVFQHMLESKALGVLPNPADFNLFMVQTGTVAQQLRLFDIRVQRTELHAFGWIQEAGETQSGYVSQSWSPDGLYCASGSTDPKIHVFDIRYNSREPVQTLNVHQKRVFKAAWHPNLPLLLSISSDLFVGLHKIFQ